MFERFTEQAIKSVMLANEEAHRLGHNFVGTEQILLGLVGQGTGVAAQVLDSMGVNLQNTRVEVEKIIGRGTGLVAAEIPFTPRAKQLLERALAEADRLSHSNIDTEHLLLSLIQIQEGVAARVLKSLGVDFAEVRTQVSTYQHYLQQPADEHRVDRVDGNELPMTEHLTPRAIKVILLAQQESHLLGHNSIGTEHIFLGLIGESSGRAAKVLKSMGVSLNKARSEVEKNHGSGCGHYSSRDSVYVSGQASTRTFSGKGQPNRSKKPRPRTFTAGYDRRTRQWCSESFREFGNRSHESILTSQPTSASLARLAGLLAIVKSQPRPLKILGKPQWNG